MDGVNIFTSFLAGLVSFLAPCSFSLIPIYLSYISGISVTEYQNNPQKSSQRVIIASLSYAFGFILFLCVIGLGLTFLNGFFLRNQELWRIVGGILIVVFGIYMLIQNKLKIEFLLGTHKIEFLKQSKNGKGIYITAFTIGFINAFAWTPCIGPIYGAIISLATTSSSRWAGLIYLIVYGIGLMLPFVLMGIFFGRSQKIVKKLSKYSNTIYKIMAVIFIILGIMLITDTFNTILVVNIIRLFELLGLPENKLPFYNFG